MFLTLNFPSSVLWVPIVIEGTNADYHHPLPHSANYRHYVNQSLLRDSIKHAINLQQTGSISYPSDTSLQVETRNAVLTECTKFNREHNRVSHKIS